MKIVRRTGFELDVVELYAGIAIEQPASAERFAEEVDEMLVALGELPLHCRVWRPNDQRVEGVRVRKVPGFKVLMFYLVDQEHITILRLMHGARNDLAEAIADELP